MRFDAIVDALALAVARRRKFTDEDFAKRHPGGALGGLLRPATEMLRFRVGHNCPLIDQGISVREALERAAEAHALMEANQQIGKIVLVVDPGQLGGEAQ